LPAAHHPCSFLLTKNGKEINQEWPSPLCMCHCLGKACPAPGGAPPRFTVQTTGSFSFLFLFRSLFSVFFLFIIIIIK
jgi:hypothetical protein